MNKRIIFMGTPAFAVASLNALLEAGMEVAAVVTAPDRPAGRGRQLRMSAVKERAISLGVPVLQPGKLKDPDFLARLDELDASLYIVVAFRMLPEVVWRKPQRGTVNLHASLLPNYRGAAPINWALINGEARTGVTTFFINDKIDTGDILLREEVDIRPEDNAGSLHDRLMTVGADLLVRTAKDLLDNTSSRTPQALVAGDTGLREAPKLTPANCMIDWNWDAQRVHNHVRGLSPYPGAWTRWHEEGTPGRQMKVLGTKLPAKTGGHVTPGTVLIANERIEVQCGDGPIEITQLQMEGKRPMGSSDFLRGLQRRASFSVG